MGGFIKQISRFLHVNCKKFYVDDKGNLFVLFKSNGERVYNPKIKGLKVEFHGHNSIVEIHEPCQFKNCELKMKSNCTIKIEETKYLINNLKTENIMQDNTTVEIGKNFLCCGLTMILADEPNLTVKIGKDCMFARNCVIFPSDSHSIFNENGTLINLGESVVIGNHVWLGLNVSVLKGSIIPDNCVVGYNSVYTKASIKYYKVADTNLGAVFAGAPAKVVKTNINWSKANPCYRVEW
ncbi:MAG: hypothetical protein IKP05_01375 [Alphaproteobacteria bacterium]|nr:hypothetical protein [Alphaproteobacteria bacterium]